jgi:hypothetical protein
MNSTAAMIIAPHQSRNVFSIDFFLSFGWRNFDPVYIASGADMFDADVDAFFSYGP